MGLLLSSSFDGEESMIFKDSDVVRLGLPSKICCCSNGSSNGVVRLSKGSCGGGRLINDYT